MKGMDVLESLISFARTEFLQSPIATISGAMVIVATIFAFTHKGRKIFFSTIKYFSLSRKSHIPRQTIIIIENPHNQSWNMGGEQNDPAMWVTVGLHVTNISNEKIKILSCKLLPSGTPGLVFTKHEKDNIYGIYSIASKDTAHLSMSFCIKPPIVSKSDNFKGKIILVDSFGNEHKSKEMLFNFSD